jgi:Arc/MetJ-type ribon-helix-helix transcriptional regulator
VRATVMLKPGDYVRGLYEELVSDMGVSGAEVIREALIELHKRESRRKARRAAQNANTDTQELPQTG